MVQKNQRSSTGQYLIANIKSRNQLHSTNDNKNYLKNDDGGLCPPSESINQLRKASITTEIQQTNE